MLFGRQTIGSAIFMHKKERCKMKNVKTIAMTLALVAGVAGTAFAADIRDIVFTPSSKYA